MFLKNKKKCFIEANESDVITRGERTDKILTSLSVQLKRVVQRVQYYRWYPYQADYHNQQSMRRVFCKNT